MNFPTLYKKTATGAIQYWKIWTEHNIIKTAYGQVGGAEQITEDTIHNGKNIGRSNETTADQQAELEAKANWTKKKKKNYVEEIARAENDETDVKGGFDVMLAHKYSEQGHKIEWPAYGQPKLDGIRMIAIVDKGKCTLWTRTRKPITGIPHIQRELEKLFPTGYHIFDGEAYNHAFKHDFEQIVSYVRSEEPIEGHEVVQYHIYDLPIDGTFEERLFILNRSGLKKAKYIRLVDTYFINDEDEAMSIFYQMLENEYEGLMLRNRNGIYVSKRSYDLQKVKEFEESEFPIIGIGEGRGKLQGHVGHFILSLANGETFEAKLMGPLENLKKAFENHNIWKDKMMTVIYQGFTKYGKPRFPRGKVIRDYE